MKLRDIFSCRLWASLEFKKQMYLLCTNVWLVTKLGKARGSYPFMLRVSWVPWLQILLSVHVARNESCLCFAFPLHKGASAHGHESVRFLSPKFQMESWLGLMLCTTSYTMHGTRQLHAKLLAPHLSVVSAACACTTACGPAQNAAVFPHALLRVEPMIFSPSADAKLDYWFLALCARKYTAWTQGKRWNSDDFQTANITLNMIQYQISWWLMKSLSGAFFPNNGILSTGGLEINLQPKSQLTEKHNVSLQCTADKLTFENLTWYKFSPRPSMTRLGGLPMPVCKNLDALQKLNTVAASTNGENVTVELLLRHISRHDSGDYVCIAQEKKTKIRHCLVKHLTIQGNPRLGELKADDLLLISALPLGCGWPSEEFCEAYELLL